jgi:hypothetical protein
VARIDSKIDLAKAETMRIYKSVLTSSSSLAAAPVMITTNRMSAATDLCRALITCFGMPKVSAETAFSIYRQTMPDDIGNGFAVAFAEAFAALGLFGTIITGGIVPVFLASEIVNVPLIVPANARLLLMLASDLILIFARSFREASAKCVTQPLAGDVQRATSAYRAHCKEVHRRVSELIRKRDVVKAFKVGVVEKGFADIIEEFKKKVMETMQAPTSGSTFISDKGDDTISADMADIKDAFDYVHEVKEQMTVTKDAGLPPEYAAIGIWKDV